MRNARRYGAVTMLAAGALVLSSCSAGGEAPAASSETELTEAGFALQRPEPQPGGTLTVLGSVDLSHLDPAMGNDGNVNNVYNLLYRQLTQYQYDPATEELTLVGDLATDTGTPNEDATQWTFTLRDDIFFEDGTPITAADIAFGIERSLDPTLAIGNDEHLIIQGASEYAGIYEDPAGLPSIETPDDKTITFTLEQPLAAFADVAATQIFTPFPEGQVSATQLDEMPISSGPYRVESYERGSHLSLVRNEHWSAETDEIRPAHLDGYEFLFGLDPSTIDQRLISAQGDDVNAMASSTNGLLPANLAQLSADPGMTARTIQSLPTCTMYLALNTTRPGLDDLQVRQAISYAVDRASVVTATGGPAMASTASDMLTPQVPGRYEFDLYPSEGDAGDVETARQMLEDAGYADGELNFTMDVRNLPKWQAQAQSVQQSLQEVGIGVELNVIDAATFYEVVATPAQQNDLTVTGWCSAWLSGNPLLTALFDGDAIAETGNTNISQLDDPEINARFDEVAVIPDIDEQNEAYAALNEQILELAPVVPLVRETPLQMVGSNVGGAYAHAGRTGYIDYASVGLIDPEG